MTRQRLFGAILLGAACAAAATGVWWARRSGESPRAGTGPVCDDVFLAEGVDLDSTAGAAEARLIRAAAAGAGTLGSLTIDYPQSGSVFPPEMVPPTFLWHDATGSDAWVIDVQFAGGAGRIRALASGDPPPAGEVDPRCFGDTNQPHTPTPYQASAKSWTPGDALWAAIRDGSAGRTTTVRVLGFRKGDDPARATAAGSMTLTTSTDPVGAPIFYRDVPLMPTSNDEGVIKPLAKEALPLIQWRLRDIARPASRVVLTNMPTCANCHSFSADGRTLGMDMDGPSGDKGAYGIAPIAQTMTITSKETITWNSFKDKPPGHKTIGFLSQVSPDGRYVVTTVNESVFVANFTDYRFLQVFYPTRGILATYDRDTGEMKALPGADDTKYVHSDAAWWPDGKTLVFARAEACDPRPGGRPLPQRANDPAETPMQYDLYRMPFNDGRGGQATAIAGASANGMSNTFPKVSPDGKWIVFVKCKNGQLMRPDGRLWIVPAGGGTAREMRCNTPLMNSWHSFSPNGRWMVFASKANTPYTQMFLTHLDEAGLDSPPILIPNSTAANRAVNIPEFVNIGYDDLVAIRAPVVEYRRHYARGVQLARDGKRAEAVAEFEKALAVNPDDAQVHFALGNNLFHMDRPDEAVEHFGHVFRIRPRAPMAHNNVAEVYARMGRYDDALAHYGQAIKLMIHFAPAWRNRASLRWQLGDLPGAEADYSQAVLLSPKRASIYVDRAGVRLERGKLAEAIADANTAIKLDTGSAKAWCVRGALRQRNGAPADAMADYNEALRLEPKLTPAYIGRGNALLDLERITDAISDFDRAVELAPAEPMAWCGRGEARLAGRDPAGAAGDLARALKLGGAKWPHRARVRAILRRINAGAGPGP